MAKVAVSAGILLDGRLALFHEGERWLALADTHFGYSEAMRQAGALFPVWGNETILTRLQALCADYRPDFLIILGDLVHGRVCRNEFGDFLQHLRALASKLILIRGNHDRSPTVEAASFVESWSHGAFFFHHGHLDLPAPPGCIEVTGHWHPAVSLRDGAGLSLKLPAFVQLERRWILPAFSPWAGGKTWNPHDTPGARRWACSPHGVFELPD